MCTPCDFVWAGVFTVCVCRMRIVEVCLSVRACLDMCGWAGPGSQGVGEEGKLWTVVISVLVGADAGAICGSGFGGRLVNCKCE